MSTLIAKEQPAELGLKGKGVEIVQIPEIDTLVKKYNSEKEAFGRAGTRFNAASDELMAAMHEHAAELREPDGALLYKFDGTIVSVARGKEKLKVEEAKESK